MWPSLAEAADAKASGAIDGSEGHHARRGGRRTGHDLPPPKPAATGTAGTDAEAAGPLQGLRGFNQAFKAKLQEWLASDQGQKMSQQISSEMTGGALLVPVALVEELIKARIRSLAASQACRLAWFFGWRAAVGSALLHVAKAALQRLARKRTPARVRHAVDFVSDVMLPTAFFGPMLGITFGVLELSGVAPSLALQLPSIPLLPGFGKRGNLAKPGVDVLQPLAAVGTAAAAATSAAASAAAESVTTAGAAAAGTVAMAGAAAADTVASASAAAAETIATAGLAAAETVASVGAAAADSVASAGATTAEAVAAAHLTAVEIMDASTGGDAVAGGTLPATRKAAKTQSASKRG